VWAGVCVWCAPRVCLKKCLKGPGRDACDAVATVRGHRAWQSCGEVEARHRQDDDGAGKVRGAHGLVNGKAFQLG
jgi:hypothetical protein